MSGREIQLPPIQELIQTRDGREQKIKVHLRREERERRKRERERERRKGASTNPIRQSLARSEKPDWKIMRYCCPCCP